MPWAALVPWWKELGGPLWPAARESWDPQSNIPELTLLVTREELEKWIPPPEHVQWRCRHFPWLCVSYWKIFRLAKPDLMAMFKGQGQGHAQEAAVRPNWVMAKSRETKYILLVEGVERWQTRGKYSLARAPWQPLQRSCLESHGQRHLAGTGSMGWKIAAGHDQGNQTTIVASLTH